MPPSPLAPAQDTPDDTADPIDSAPLTPSLRSLARMGVMRKLHRGAQIISEGEVGDTLFIVLSGRLRAYSISDDGREITYGIYGPGEYVGEMSFDREPRSASVEALDAVLCVSVNRATLMRHFTADPSFVFDDLLPKVIGRARTATHHFKQITLGGVYGALKTHLEGLVQLQADGSWLACPAPSHLEMSQTLGCSREMVSRVMKALERLGHVETGRRRVRILKRLPRRLPRARAGTPR